MMFASNSSILFSVVCGAGSGSGTVCQWNTASGKLSRAIKTQDLGVKKIAVSVSGDRILAAGTGIEMYDLASGRLLAKYIGHQSTVKSLSWTKDGHYFASVAASDRFISVWDASVAGNNTHTHTKPRQALYVLSLVSMPTQLVFNPFIVPGQAGQGEDEQLQHQYQLACITDGSHACVWNLELKKNAAKKDKKNKNVSTISKPDCTIRVAATASTASKSTRKRRWAKVQEMDGPLVAVSFTSATRMLVARGSSVKPGFEQVNLEKSGKEVILDRYNPTLTPSGEVEGAGATSNKSKNKRQATGTATATVKTIVEGSAGSSLALSNMRNKNKTSTFGKNDSSRREAMLSMEQRLKNVFGARQKERKNMQANGNGNGSTDGPQAGSLKAALEQALHTNDNQLLEYCLENRNEESIRETVAKVSPKHVLALIKAVGDRFQTRPSRRHLVKWIKHTLLAHTGFLLTVPSLANQLAGLCKTFESRLGVFQKLLKLQGRLEVVMGMENSILLNGINENGINVDVQGEGGAVVVMEEDAHTQELVEIANDAEDDDSDDDSDDDDDNSDNGTSASGASSVSASGSDDSDNDNDGSGSNGTDTSDSSEGK